MKIAMMDDYPDAFRRLSCYTRLKDHAVTVFNDTEQDPAKLAERLKDADAVSKVRSYSSGVDADVNNFRF